MLAARISEAVDDFCAAHLAEVAAMEPPLALRRGAAYGRRALPELPRLLEVGWEHVWEEEPLAEPMRQWIQPTPTAA